MITTSDVSPQRRRPGLPWEVLDWFYQGVMERKIDLGFGALAAERGLAITSDQMFRDVYLALDEEGGERASRMGSALLCREIGISREELDQYLEHEGADPPSAKLAAAFLRL